jgi:phosphonate transport system substrate-binding protein
MRPLTFVSLMAPLARPFYAALADYLCARTRLPVRFFDEGTWEERSLMLSEGGAQLGVVCGLQYVLRRDQGACAFEPLAAPVMAHPRYGGRPVYFSDVVVSAQSHFGRFAELRGGAVAFNEATSHSGYNVLKAHLARIGEPYAFFGSVVKGHAHQNSLQLVLTGVVDAAAIDSTVLELECRREPSLRERLRVIETLGPSPMPPLVAHPSMPPGYRIALRAALLELGESPESQRLLNGWMKSRFAEVSDGDYDPIRRMARDADPVVLSEDTGVQGPLLCTGVS